MAKGKYKAWMEKEKLVLMSGWARDGLSDEQIAKNMGVSRSTLNDWSKKYPDISDALKKGKDIADYEVENALYKSACGYEYEESVEEKDNKGNIIGLKIFKRYAPPNVAAIVFWLKNRMKGKWVNNDNILLGDSADPDEACGIVSLAPIDVESARDAIRAYQQQAEGMKEAGVHE
ncbi:MAG: helix-turn-helix domain containing protein [[Clostridium] aminophilum]|uniref:helix-turn-helix domain-containing protein n=1 Tax=[Clostridium] aminophilum TaxID=1526 RepID=UPI0026F0914C|nr:helix-turn-helix domain-containing protein [[Clostridium] aminophilum]MDD6195413.1 helix-turn-helix domain containing protein [[Clostridium] aminophilum]